MLVGKVLFAMTYQKRRVTLSRTRDFDNFRSLRKISKSENNFRYVCLPICPSAWNNSATNGRILL